MPTSFSRSQASARFATPFAGRSRICTDMVSPVHVSRIQPSCAASCNSFPSFSKGVFWIENSRLCFLMEADSSCPVIDLPLADASNWLRLSRSSCKASCAECHLGLLSDQPSNLALGSLDDLGDRDRPCTAGRLLSSIHSSVNEGTASPGPSATSTSLTQRRYSAEAARRSERSGPPSPCSLTCCRQRRARRETTCSSGSSCGGSATTDSSQFSSEQAGSLSSALCATVKKSSESSSESLNMR